MFSDICRRSILKYITTVSSHFLTCSNLIFTFPSRSNLCTRNGSALCTNKVDYSPSYRVFRSALNSCLYGWIHHHEIHICNMISDDANTVPSMLCYEILIHTAFPSMWLIYTKQRFVLYRSSSVHYTTATGFDLPLTKRPDNGISVYQAATVKYLMAIVSILHLHNSGLLTGITGIIFITFNA